MMTDRFGQKYFYGIALLFFIIIGFIVGGSSIGLSRTAFIDARYVDQLYMGTGLVFDRATTYEGYTSPLWMVSLVIIRGIGGDAIHGAVFLSLIFSILTILYLLFRPDSYRKWFPFALFGLVGLHGFPEALLNGGQTALLFLILVFAFTEMESRSLARKPFYFGLYFSFLFLAQELFLTIYILYGVLLILELSGRIPSVQTGSNVDTNSTTDSDSEIKFPGMGLAIVRYVSSFAIVAGPYLLFRFLYFGQWTGGVFPVDTSVTAGERLLEFLTVMVYSPGLWLLLALFLWVIFFSGNSRGNGRSKGFASPYFRTALSGVVLIIAYILFGSSITGKEGLYGIMILLFLSLDQRLRETSEDLPFQSPYGPYFIMGGFALATFLVPVISPGQPNRPEWKLETTGAYGVRMTIQHDPGIQKGMAYGELRNCLGYDDLRLTVQDSDGSGNEPFEVVAYGAGPYVSVIPVHLSNDGLKNEKLTDILKKGAILHRTEDEDYNRIMETDAGVVVSFDEDLLSTLPDVESRFLRLQKLKEMKNKTIIEIEHYHHKSLESLLKQMPSWKEDTLQSSKQKCWLEFPNYSQEGP